MARAPPEGAAAPRRRALHHRRGAHPCVGRRRAPEAASEARKQKLKFIENQDISYSPDLNPIENLFSNADNYLVKMHFGKGPGEGPAATWQVTWQRFLDACAHIAGMGEVKKMATSMPERCEDVIEADGGATKW